MLATQPRIGDRLEYHLLSRDVGKAKECLEKARSLIGSLKDEKKKAKYTNILKYADDLYKYYVRYAGRS